MTEDEDEGLGSAYLLLMVLGLLNGVLFGLLVVLIVWVMVTR